MKDKRNNKWVNLIIVIAFLLGMFFFLMDPIKYWIVSYGIDSLRTTTSNATEIEKNTPQASSFQFEEVRELDLQTIVMANMNKANITILGGISIPNVGMNLPIGEGVSNATLALTAGTMKKEQVMGEGNYALAGHHMKRQNLLFSPLFKVKIGDPVYLTDLHYIYEYRIEGKSTIEATDIEVIEDRVGEKTLTLITCDLDGTKRLSIRGAFVRKLSVEKATTEMKEAFQLEVYNE